MLAFQDLGFISPNKSKRDLRFFPSAESVLTVHLCHKCQQMVVNKCLLVSPSCVMWCAQRASEWRCSRCRLFRWYTSDLLLRQWLPAFLQRVNDNSLPVRRYLEQPQQDTWMHPWVQKHIWRRRQRDTKKGWQWCQEVHWWGDDSSLKSLLGYTSNKTLFSCELSKYCLKTVFLHPFFFFFYIGILLIWRKKILLSQR